MSRICWLLVVSPALFLSFCSRPTRGEEQAFRPQKKWALHVASGQKTDPSATEVANQLAQTLEANYGYEPQVLADGQATLKNLNAALVAIGRQGSPNDTLFLFLDVGTTVSPHTWQFQKRPRKGASIRQTSFDLAGGDVTLEELLDTIRFQLPNRAVLMVINGYVDPESLRGFYNPHAQLPQQAQQQAQQGFSHNRFGGKGAPNLPPFQVLSHSPQESRVNQRQLFRSLLLQQFQGGARTSASAIVGELRRRSLVVTLHYLVPGDVAFESNSPDLLKQILNRKLSLQTRKSLIADLPQAVLDSPRSRQDEFAKDSADAMLELAAEASEDLSVRSQSLWAVGQLGRSDSVPGLRRLIERLDNAFLETRALETLTEIDVDEAIPLLRQAMRSDDTVLSTFAIRKVGKIGDKASLPELLRLLDGENPEVVTAALDIVPVLADADDREVIETLKQATSHPDPGIRSRAISTLAVFDVSSEELAENLPIWLKDEKANVRQAAAHVATRIRNIPMESVDALANALADPEMQVRRAAAAALSELDIGQNTTALDIAVPRLIDAISDTEDPQVRAQVIETLGVLKASDAVDEIAERLSPKMERQAEVRRACAVALGSIGDADSVNALRDAVGDSSSVVSQAAQAALRQIEAYVPIDDLREKLNDRQLSVRIQAIEAMAESENPEAAVVVDLLDRLTESSFALEHEALVSALSRLGLASAQARTEINQALGEEDSSLRAGVAEVLGIIGDVEATADLADQFPAESNNLVRSSVIRALGMIDGHGARDDLMNIYERANRDGRRFPDSLQQSLASAFASQAELLANREMYDSAKEFAEKTLEFQRFGTLERRDFREAAENTTALMSYLYLDGDADDAIRLAEEVSESKAFTYWDSAAKASLSEGLGQAYVQKDDYDAAEKYFLDSVAIRESRYGERDIRLAGTLDGLAWVYASTDADDKMRQAQDRAFRIRATYYMPEISGWRDKGWLDRSTHGRIEDLIWSWGESLSGNTELTSKQKEVLVLLDDLTVGAKADAAQVNELADKVRHLPVPRSMYKE